MTTLEPVAAVLTTSTGTQQQHFEALFTFFSSATPQHWSVDSSTTDPGTGALTGFTLKQGTSPFQKLVFVRAGSEIKVSLNVNDETTSPQVDFFRSTVTGNSKFAVVAEYPDAIFWAVNNTAETAVLWSLHAGVTMASLSANDVSNNYITGHALHTGAPGAQWAGGSSNGFSLVRIGQGNWMRPGSATSIDDNGGKVTNRTLLPPSIISTGTSDATTKQGVWLGVFKYYRQSDTYRVNRSVIPSVNTNQGWMHITESASQDAKLIAWNKLVTPPAPAT